MRLINIGFGNIVFANRLIAIVSPESAPVKRLVQDARDRGMLIDATYGRRTRAVLIADSDHVILSAVQPETVANRLAETDVNRSTETVANRSTEADINRSTDTGVNRYSPQDGEQTEGDTPDSEPDGKRTGRAGGAKKRRGS